MFALFYFCFFFFQAEDGIRDVAVTGVQTCALPILFLEHLEDQEGAVVLSKKKADFMRVWERIREAHERDEAVSGTLVKKIKGGVVVDLMGVDAFLPGSQIALRRVPNIDELLGQSFEVKIIKLNKRRR